MMGLWPLCSSVQRASALQILTRVKKEFRIGSHLATLSTLSVDKPALQNCRHDRARACQRINKSSFSSPSYLLIHSKGCANVSSNLTLPPLMDAPPIMWPKLINTIRNWIFTVFVIRPHMDREFSLTEFDKGARQVCLLSDFLRIRQLEIVTKECRKSFESMTVFLNMDEK